MPHLFLKETQYKTMLVSWLVGWSRGTRSVGGLQLELEVEQGNHVVPNMAECFPAQTASESELAAMPQEVAPMQ